MGEATTAEIGEQTRAQNLERRILEGVPEWKFLLSKKKREELIPWSPHRETIKLAAPEAKGFILYKGLCQLLSRNNNPDVLVADETLIPDDIVFDETLIACLPKVSKTAARYAVDTAFKGYASQLAFFISNAYDILEETIELVKNTAETEGQRDHSKFPYCGSLKTIKLKLADLVLLPLEIYEEAAVLFEEYKKLDEAFDAYTKASLQRTVEFCERNNCFFSSCLRKIRLAEDIGDEEKESLQEKLEKAHMKAVLDGTDLQLKRHCNKLSRLLDVQKWINAYDCAKEYDYSPAQLNDIRNKGLDAALNSADAMIVNYSSSYREETINQFISDASFFIRKLPEEEKQAAEIKLIDALSKHSHYHAMKYAVQKGFKDIAIREAKAGMPKTKEFFEAEILPNADTALIREYFEEFRLKDREDEKDAALAKKLGFESGLIDICIKQERYEHAAWFSAKLDRKMPIDQLIELGLYRQAINRTQDPYEKAKLHLLSAEECAQRIKEYHCTRSIWLEERWDAADSLLSNLHAALEDAKKSEKIQDINHIASSAIDLLKKHDLYAEAILFNRKYQCTKEIEIPESAFQAYESRLDFACCAFLAEAKGLEKEAKDYKALALANKQKVPRKIEDTARIVFEKRN